jgi:hypothetical protein
MGEGSERQSFLMLGAMLEVDIERYFTRLRRIMLQSWSASIIPEKRITTIIGELQISPNCHSRNQLGTSGPHTANDSSPAGPYPIGVLALIKSPSV